ncbi:hypothetical protein BD324DRAFT_678261 [Kockovaella imperatae]|uniref:Uncharacterized protein n=1 Tax=Kockovaella imperatae TaxID=4999 RepID=A0A1Y1US30_9TREE|nr:hypothetical protein BD324DRAFT_678261 [Kockovaella imperatae]ORX40841.1 hypothetical protein BD324DRAFT_678261 [Kockovaella imperatae]
MSRSHTATRSRHHPPPPSQGLAPSQPSLSHSSPMPLPPSSQPPPPSTADLQHPARLAFPPDFMGSQSPSPYPHSKTPWAAASLAGGSHARPSHPMPSGVRYCTSGPQYGPMQQTVCDPYPSPSQIDLWAPTLQPSRPGHDTPSYPYHEYAIRTDHYHPTQVHHRAPPVSPRDNPLPTPGTIRTASRSASPKSGSDVYREGNEPRRRIKTMGEKVMYVLDGIVKDVAEVKRRVEASEEATGRVRDNLHDTQVLVKSLPSKEETAELLGGLFSTAFQEQLASLIEQIPNQTRTLFTNDLNDTRQKIIAEMMVSNKLSFERFKHTDSKLEKLSELEDTLSSLKELPEAVKSVAVFKNALQAMEMKVKAATSSSITDRNMRTEESEHDNCTISRAAIARLTSAVEALASKVDQQRNADKSVLDHLSTRVSDLVRQVSSIADIIETPSMLHEHNDRFQMLQDQLKDNLAEIKALRSEAGASKEGLVAISAASKSKRSASIDEFGPVQVITCQTAAKESQHSSATETDSLESRTNIGSKPSKKRKTTHAPAPATQFASRYGTRSKSIEIQQVIEASLCSSNGGENPLAPPSTSPADSLVERIVTPRSRDGTSERPVIIHDVDEDTPPSNLASVSLEGDHPISKPTSDIYTAKSSKSPRTKTKSPGRLPVISYDASRKRKAQARRKNRSVPARNVTLPPTGQNTSLSHIPSSFNEWLQPATDQSQGSRYRGEGQNEGLRNGSAANTQVTEDFNHSLASDDDPYITSLAEAMNKTYDNPDVMLETRPAQMATPSKQPKAAHQPLGLESYVTPVRDTQRQVGTQLSPNDAGGQGPSPWQYSDGRVPESSHRTAAIPSGDLQVKTPISKTSDRRSVSRQRLSMFNQLSA